VKNYMESDVAKLVDDWNEEKMVEKVCECVHKLELMVWTATQKLRAIVLSSVQAN